MRYCPSAFVVTVVEMLVLSARRTTFAPLTTEPDGSVTVPLTPPVGEACPNTCPERLVNSRTKANVNRRIVVISSYREDTPRHLIKWSTDDAGCFTTAPESLFLFWTKCACSEE